MFTAIVKRFTRNQQPSQAFTFTPVTVWRLTLANDHQIDFSHRQTAIGWLVMNASIQGQTPKSLDPVVIMKAVAK